MSVWQGRRRSGAQAERGAGSAAPCVHRRMQVPEPISSRPRSGGTARLKATQPRQPPRYSPGLSRELPLMPALALTWHRAARSRDGRASARAEVKGWVLSEGLGEAWMLLAQPAVPRRGSSTYKRQVRLKGISCIPLESDTCLGTGRGGAGKGSRKKAEETGKSRKFAHTPVGFPTPCHNSEWHLSFQLHFRCLSADDGERGLIYPS